MRLKLLVGLGNPGKEYAATRHNAGVWWLQAVCEVHRVPLQHEPKFRCHVAQFQVEGEKVFCIQPTTYMNLSGQAVESFAEYYKISPNDMLIAHDELDLPPGRIRLKHGGGHGGHNGLRDIIPRIGAEFYRLRVGIGHPGDKDQVSDYVLEKPSKMEQEQINTALDLSLHQLPKMLSGEWAAAMNELHARC